MSNLTSKYSSILSSKKD